MATNSDVGPGLGITFSLVSVLAAVATAVLGYQYALGHGGEGARAIQINAGVAFGVAMLAAGLAIAAVHVYHD